MQWSIIDEDQNGYASLGLTPTYLVPLRIPEGRSMRQTAKSTIIQTFGTCRITENAFRLPKNSANNNNSFEKKAV